MDCTKNFLIILCGLVAFQLNAQRIDTNAVALEDAFLCDTRAWKLVFEDEFEGNTLKKHWYTYYPKGQADTCAYCRTHGDKENQIYLDENVKINNGILELIAKRQDTIWYDEQRSYTSGMIHSFPAFEGYARFETRCKIPKGAGFWPGFWMFGHLNEIDVLEFNGDKPNRHFVGIRQWQKPRPIDDGRKYYSETDYSEDFHVFVVEYEENYIRFYVDNSIVFTVSKYYEFEKMKWRRFSQVPTYRAVKTCAIPKGKYYRNMAYPNDNEPMRIIANLSISTGIKGMPFYPGPNAKTVFPNKFEIDYIRVYQKEKEK
jgi:beta-glucanase (GH16 family)